MDQMNKPGYCHLIRMQDFPAIVLALPTPLPPPRLCTPHFSTHAQACTSNTILLARRPSQQLVDDDDTQSEQEATIAAATPPHLHSSLSTPRPGSPPRALLTPFSLPAVPLDTCFMMMTHNCINFPNHCSGVAAALSTRLPLPPPLHSSLSAPLPVSPSRALCSPPPAPRA